MKILIVEDQPELAEHLLAYLARHDFQAEHCRTGTEALGRMEQRKYDLLLLDLGLPDLPGLQVMQKAHQVWGDLKVIVVSARTDAQGVAQVMDAGADDYLRKPLHLGELRSRIEAVARRGRKVSLAPCFQHKGFELDSRAACLRANGKALLLTPTEQQVLHLLFAHPTEVIPFATFLQQVWGDVAGESDGNVLHVYVNTLRKKARRLSKRPLIQTCRRVGYRLA